MPLPDVNTEFKSRLENAFEAMTVGQSFAFRRTFTDGDVSVFCGVTGDFNPYHLDDAFASQSWFERRIIPGLLTASMATHIGGMIGFLAAEMRFEYLAPVFVGDTVLCRMTVTERDAQARRVIFSGVWTNQDGKEVLKGTTKGFPSKIRIIAE